ncbi:hypothetical protein DTO166G4_4158 [Paecilomyces variotii]|nr:hypothetical protein DTO166G4_4158 [Paecilomyces variotii]KAJ9231176.1 hypothetical protein DTO166G5_6948 [Paecilomyces variotii]KAJ9366062.1 hypothetical protein DTO282E5_9256 [Paecilomyces variotii]
MSTSQSFTDPSRQDVDFCTLGMFILDDIEFGEGIAPVKGALGGAASFAVVGARMVAGREHSQSVSWIVDVGCDFPNDVLDVIRSWNTKCVIREDKGRLTTRAWNGYGPNEKRDFKYLTPKLRLEPDMLSEQQVFSRTFHMVCSSVRAVSIVQRILERREELLQKGYIPPSSGAATRPLFVWEPVPDLCTPEEQERFFTAIRVVDVVSPNELELGMMFGRPGWDESNEDDRELVRKILKSGIGPDGNGTLVIRAGKNGSYSYSRGHGIWLPAYHQPDPSNPPPVVDPTGGGNSFLGALAEGMISQGRSPVETIESVLAPSESWKNIVQTWGKNGQIPLALICATVAAGFVVEQIGVPKISEKDGKETWNGSEFTERVRLYTQRLYRTLEESPQRHQLSL